MNTLQLNKRAVNTSFKAMKAAMWLQSLPGRITPAAFRLLQIGSAFWQSRALHAATRLDIATVLADSSLSVEEISARIGASPDAVCRLLRLLCAMGVFAETAPRVFRNSKVSAFLRSDNPRNVRAMVLMHNSDEMSRPWYEQLEQGLLGRGVPFQLANGLDLYAYMSAHPRFDSLFSQAMDTVDTLAGSDFAKDIDWGRFERIIDVGGSKGRKSMAILKRHAHLRSLVVDRASIIDEARHYWRDKEDGALLARICFQPGDVLDAIPAAVSDKDVYLLSAVLHTFDDETCIRALRNLQKASAQAGACAVLLEMVMDESQPSLTRALVDMQMFMGTPGRERTLREWLGLFARSGLELVETVVVRPYNQALVVRAKAARA